MATKRDRQREATRGRLYSAALEAFRAEGVAAVSIERIAARAGVSRATFYFHFPTKEAVLLARLAQSEEAVAEAVKSCAADASLDVSLAALHDRMAVDWEDDREIMFLAAVESLRHFGDPQLRAQASAVYNAVITRFARAHEQGSLAEGPPPALLANMFLMDTLAAALTWFGTGAPSLRALLGQIRTCFLYGAVARDDAGR